MCMEKEETINHLLLHCSKIRVLWELLFSLFGVSWVLLCSVRETLLSWQISSVGKKHRKVWRAAPLHIFWTVWKARNQLAFKDDEISIQIEIFLFILALVWGKAVYSRMPSNFGEFYRLVGIIVRFLGLLGAWVSFFVFGFFDGGCIGLYTLHRLYT